MGVSATVALPCDSRAEDFFHAPLRRSWGPGQSPDDRVVFSGPTHGLFPSTVTASALATPAGIRRGFSQVAQKGGDESNGDHLGGWR